MIADLRVSFYLKICYSNYYYSHVSSNQYFILQHNYSMIIFPYGLFIHNFSIINQLYLDVSFHQQTNDFIDFVILNELVLEQQVTGFQVREQLEHRRFGLQLHLKEVTSYPVENCNYFITISNILKTHRLHLEQLMEQNLGFQERTCCLIQIGMGSFENFFVFIKFKSCYIKPLHRFSLQIHLQTCECLNHFWLFVGDCTLHSFHELQNQKK